MRKMICCNIYLYLQISKAIKIGVFISLRFYFRTTRCCTLKAGSQQKIGYPWSVARSVCVLFITMSGQLPPPDDLGGKNTVEAVKNGDVVFILDPETRCRVSSALLSCASPVFTTMLNGNFMEGQILKSAENPAEIAIQDDDHEAFIFLCNLLHFRHDATSVLDNQEPTLLAEKLVRLAIAVDKYDCVNAFCLIGEGLLSRCARETLPFVGMALLASAAYLLQSRWYFALFTRRLILRYNESFTTLHQSLYGDLLPTPTICKSPHLLQYCRGNRLILHPSVRGRAEA
jgi:hypothetical protein